MGVFPFWPHPTQGSTDVWSKHVVKRVHDDHIVVATHVGWDYHHSITHTWNKIRIRWNIRRACHLVSNWATPYKRGVVDVKGTLQNCLRSKIYINLRDLNYDDSRNVPLKYFCLKCHIWWEIKTNFLYEVYRSRSDLFICFLIHKKMCNWFFIIFSWPRWQIDLKLLQVCQLLCTVDYIKCFHCQQLLIL